MKKFPTPVLQVKPYFFLITTVHHIGKQICDVTNISTQMCKYLKHILFKINVHLNNQPRIK